MERRDAIRAGLLGTGIFLSGQESRGEFRSGPVKNDAAANKSHLPYHCGNELNITSHKILDNEVTDATTGIEDWGLIGRGVHIREFNVPEGTHLILGNVQEAGHYGSAIYETLGIALQQKIWRCRVVWKMDWDQPGQLQTYFYWTRMQQQAEL